MKKSLMKKLLLTVLAMGLVATAQSQILITQYYEGSSSNKWIEITNIGASAVNLGTSNYKLSLWSNANTEAYKTNGTPTQTFSLTGTINSGATFLFNNSAATLPTYATATASNNSVINFNGDDSLTLWIGVTFSTASIVDAIGFTDLGNEGADQSFLRISSSAGWNTTAGSEVTDFASVWSTTTNAAVDTAGIGTNERLGVSTLSVIPEPSTYALLGIGMLGLMILRRKQGQANLA